MVVCAAEDDVAAFQGIPSFWISGPSGFRCILCTAAGRSQFTLEDVNFQATGPGIAAARPVDAVEIGRVQAILVGIVNEPYSKTVQQRSGCASRRAGAGDADAQRPDVGVELITEQSRLTVKGVVGADVG